MTRKAIRVNAIRVVQDRKHPLYMFVLSAAELEEIANVQRLVRDDDGEIDGYQRTEVKRHVAAILDYLNSNRGAVLFPHALILALTSPISFAGAGGAGTSEVGTLTIPIGKEGAKPALIVDGQQRSIALSKARRRDFPVPICAFQANDLETQREQFLRVNSTHPLPRGLVAELLPHVSSTLPSRLASKRIPAALCESLNRDPRSPFVGLIKRPSYDSADRRRAVVSDSVLIGILHESFASASGALFPYRNVATSTVDFEGAKKVLYTYWGAVKSTFPEAWGRPASQSRLMHSAGLKAMGKLMDRVMATADLDDPKFEIRLRRDLARIKPKCRWISGSWEALGGLAWNELQNVPSHVRMLTEHLQRTYLAG
jgi:DGQHR domain-containing protein